MAKITINANKIIGPVKEVNAVGQPPIIGWSDSSMFHYLTEAGMPYARLHDTGGGFGGGRFVDIHNIFPDFNADPDDPESYVFTFTDPLITALIEAKVEPYFRLGETIENEHWRRAFYIHPPKDFAKWGKICTGIIRHYTQGWANGFYYPIRYWEIWNEPDANFDIEKNNMWKGTFQQYIDLYITASKIIKAEFPEVKVGGYAAIGFYPVVSDKEKTNELAWWRIQCVDDFLTRVKEANAPLDFFSWHSYGEADPIFTYAEYCADTLKRCGFEGLEQHLNEWNWEPHLRGTATHAANTAAVLTVLQKSKVDKAMFYDARCGVSIFGSLFNPMTREPLKGYWSFIAFNELFRRGTQIFGEADTEKFYVLAAKNEDDCAIMISNKTGEKQNLDLDLNGLKITSCRILDNTHDLTPVCMPESIPTDTVLLLTAK